MTAVASALCAVLGLVAVLHAYWGFGGRWPAKDSAELARMVAGAARMPSPKACLVVAGLIAVTALWPLLLARLLPTPWPPALSILGAAGLALVFLGRGVAGYVPAWRRAHRTLPFASLDRRVYSPLCLAIGLGYLLLIGQGLSS